MTEFPKTVGYPFKPWISNCIISCMINFQMYLCISADISMSVVILKNLFLVCYVEDTRNEGQIMTV